MRVHDAIRDLPTSRIAGISALGMGDPAVIPLWYGESDLPTPNFIGTAAMAALQAGHTLYTQKTGLPELRSTMRGSAGQAASPLHQVQASPSGRAAASTRPVAACYCRPVPKGVTPSELGRPCPNRPCSAISVSISFVVSR